MQCLITTMMRVIKMSYEGNNYSKIRQISLGPTKPRDNYRPNHLNTLCVVERI